LVQEKKVKLLYVATKVLPTLDIHYRLDAIISPNVTLMFKRTKDSNMSLELQVMTNMKE